MNAHNEQQPAAAQEAVAYCQPDDPLNSSAFSWPGTDRKPSHTTPLYAAPVPAAPADSLSPLARIADAFGVTGTWDQIADAVIARSTPAAPGIDMTPLSRAVELMQGVKRTLVDWANDDQKQAIEAVQSVIDASPKGATLNEQFGSAEGFAVSLFVRDCCEADKTDPGCPDTICISVGELTEIAQRHAAAASPKGDEVQDDRFPSGLADAIAYADEMEEAASALYAQVFGHETDGSDTGPDMLGKVLRELQDSPKGGSEAPTYTTGHCENHKKPGGCPLHNLQCGYPRCDRRQAGDAEVQP